MPPALTRVSDWLSALAARGRAPSTITPIDRPRTPRPITDASLLEAAALIVRARREAPRFDGTLLAVAELLSNETGTRAAIETPARANPLGPARDSLARDAACEEAPEPRADISGLTLDANRHILVVEDNAVGHDTAATALRALGARVHVAATMLEGLYALCETQFALVLLDMQIPGMGGVEALNFFRRGNGAGFRFVTPSDAPVIALTANARPGDEELLRGAGFDGILAKPLRRSRLLAMLNQRSRLLAPVSASESPSAGLPARSAATLPALLDPVALGRLIELDPTGQNRLLQRVFEAFRGSAARLSPQLRESRLSRNLAGIRHVAHTFKSSAGSIGALKLSQRCADIEIMIRTEKLQDLDACIDGMETELVVVLTALGQYLDAAP